jgi:ribosomal protein S18 acetylase RimI-like enzyme
VRGLRLFVRPIESGDHSDVCAFLDAQREQSAEQSAVGSRQSAGDPHPTHESDHGFPANCQLPTANPTPACGLLGKLLGDIVAVVSLEITGDALHIEDVLVARELRRKWIGRVMMREVEQLAAKMDRRRIVVDDARDAAEFFRRTGFEREGERWVRVVSQS